MLKKLLRYDFKSVFKYWWIAAISSFVLSLMGGGCIGLMASEKELPEVVYALAVIALVLVVLSYTAFSLVSVILVFVRFYKNFFTDEGYLTFTLPVRRSQLLNSKLIMSVTTMIITGAVCIVNVITMLCIGLADEIFTKDFWNGVSDFFNAIIDETGFYFVIYILELLIFIVLSIIFSTLFLFCCITIASIITKKAKVITAIGIYYGANSVFSFVGQIFYLFGITSLANWLSGLPVEAEHPTAALILLGILFFIAVFCALLYTLQYWMIDRKLNLN